jgi:riboflavin kinase/FMN adenylyltransferase
MDSFSTENISWSVSGKVVHGEHLGRKLGFPTANLKPDPDFNFSIELGVYAVEVEFDNLCFQGICNAGFRPTFNGTSLVIEVHLLDFTGDLYDKTITVRFISRIRGEKKFGNLEELVEQIGKDKETALKLFSSR